MTAEVNLTVKDENLRPGYLVPLPAILPAPEENRGFVFVYDAGTSTVKKTPVSFRGTQQKKALVDEGLAAGDVIAIAGVSFLADGLEVKLMKGNGK
jgi:multidrug efflux pump subunit AcrA (membrane-fusion protein)